MIKKKAFISIIATLLAVCVTLVTIHFVTYRKRSFAEITNNLCDEVDYVVCVSSYKGENIKLSQEKATAFLKSLEDANYTLNKGESGDLIPSVFHFYNSDGKMLFKLTIVISTQMIVDIDNARTFYSVGGWDYNSYW